MKDRLTEILKKCFREANSIEELTDKLITEGVIVPPCKVGMTLHFLYDSPYADKPDLTPCIYETDEWYFFINEKGMSIMPIWVHGYKGNYHYYFGKTVFLTREEAEKALAERNEDDNT